MLPLVSCLVAFTFTSQAAPEIQPFKAVLQPWRTVAYRKDHVVVEQTLGGKWPTDSRGGWGGKEIRQEAASKKQNKNSCRSVEQLHFITS